MLTDQEIKSHEIRLNAQAILSERERRLKEKKEKKTSFWKRFFWIATPVAVATSVLVPVLVTSLRPKPITPEIKDVLALGEGERISTAVVSSLYLLPTTTETSALPLSYRRISLDGFSKIVNVYEQADNLIAVQLSKTGEHFASAENVTYTGKYATYAYAITLSGETSITYHFNYAKDKENVSFKGEVTYLEKVYRIEGKNKVEGNESEYEYKALIDEENYLAIEEEKEADEYSYEYTLVEKGQEKYQLSYEKSDTIDLSFLSGGVTYAYEVDYSQAIWSIAYEDGANEGTMSLERKEGQKIYTDVASQIKIIKSSQ